VPGRSIEEIKLEYGLKEVIKLASNENLWGPPPSAVREIRKELGKIHLYPQSDPKALKQKIAKKLSISPDSIILGNGTDEIIELIAKTFLTEKDNMIVSENSFIRYKMAGRLMRAKVKEVPQKNFRIDLKAISRRIDKNTKIIFIDNPCNPTGTFVNADEIEDFLKYIKKSGLSPLVVFDEAYYEYVTDRTYSTALKFMNYKVPIMVLRTFSKIYGLAGLRIGYGISDKQVISLINRIRPPFNTNRLAQAAAMGVLDDKEFISMTSKNTLKEKKYLYKAVERLNLTYIPSQTNFILVKFSRLKVPFICKNLLKTGIILRPLTGYSLDDFIRITIGKREQNLKLIQNLKTIL
jgi:histidinol-phosphate aminotransferase